MKKFCIGIAFVFAVIIMIFGAYSIIANVRPKDDVVSKTETSYWNPEYDDEYNIKIEESRKDAIKAEIARNREIISKYMHTLSIEEQDSVVINETNDSLPEEVRNACSEINRLNKYL